MLACAIRSRKSSSVSLAISSFPPNPPSLSDHRCQRVAVRVVDLPRLRFCIELHQLITRCDDRHLCQLEYLQPRTPTTHSECNLSSSHAPSRRNHLRVRARLRSLRHNVLTGLQRSPSEHAQQSIGSQLRMLHHQHRVRALRHRSTRHNLDGLAIANRRPLPHLTRAHRPNDSTAAAPPRCQRSEPQIHHVLIVQMAAGPALHAPQSRAPVPRASCSATGVASRGGRATAAACRSTSASASSNSSTRSLTLTSQKAKAPAETSLDRGTLAHILLLLAGFVARVDLLAQARQNLLHGLRMRSIRSQRRYFW